MTILERSMQDPDTLADKDFIEAALAELEEDIAYIEQKYCTVLVGDRADFDKVYKGAGGVRCKLLACRYFQALQRNPLSCTVAFVLRRPQTF